MVTIEGENFIGASPKKVSKAGSLPITWPKEGEVDGIFAAPQGREVEEGSIIRVNVTIFGNRTREFDAKVTKFIPGELTVIEGETDIALVSLMIELFKNKRRKGTDIINTSNLTSLTRKIPERLMKARAKSIFNEYADLHCENIKKFIGVEESVASRGLSDKVLAVGS